MKNILLAFIFLFLSSIIQGQKDGQDSLGGVAGRIFLPSIDIGYLYPNSDILDGSLKLMTSIEYRFRNNNDFFIRLSYDTYGAKFKLIEDNNTTNTIEGTVQFSDVFLAPGYRFGDRTYRFVISIMPGIKFYEFPTASLNGQQILITQKSKSIFTSAFLATMEYYFDEKSAFTISLFQNQVWQEVDFWEDGGSAFGFSLGFITSLL